MEIEMLQHILVPVRVLKGHILEGDIPMERFPGFLPGLEGIAVFFLHLGGVSHVGAGLHQSGEALHIDLNGDQIGDGPDNPLHRLHHAQRIGHEYGQRSDFDHPLQGDDPAPPQHQRQRQRGGKGDHGGKQGAVMHGVYGGLLHLSGGPVEILFHFFLDHQRFGGPGAGDALIEIAGDPGVDFPDPAV